MYSFNNDYSEGACPAILERLAEINLEQVAPYGDDHYCQQARERIRSHLGRDSDVFFLTGGTQTNATVIAACLRPHQGVISSDIGHINTHESGAIEATGHKVLLIPSREGKLAPRQIEEAIVAHWNDPTRTHTVQPGMVYLSHPTEVGTLYTKKELTEIAGLCHRHGLLLYLDGARLGCALTSPQSDVALSDLAQLTDLFYIGGTKMGALFGEALVINNPTLSRDFLYQIKQRGGRLAKGWLLGLQFAELFSGDTYFQLARHANAMAEKLSVGIGVLSYGFLAPCVTNQLFPILPDRLLQPLGEKYVFQIWEKIDETRTAIRLVTSWATREEMVDAFLDDLKAMGR